MIFTPRDAEILRWINGHGFATGRQVAEWLGIRYQSIHPRLRFMTKAGYLRSERVGPQPPCLSSDESRREPMW